jgi:hypothetical protein
MAESGAGTAAQAGEERSQNGSDPRTSRAGGFGRPSLLRRFFEEVQDRLSERLPEAPAERWQAVESEKATVSR